MHNRKLTYNLLGFTRVKIKRGYGRPDGWQTDGRMGSGRTDGIQKTFSAFLKLYPRFIQKDKTRKWLRKRFLVLFNSLYGNLIYNLIYSSENVLSLFKVISAFYPKG
jgi:hypothetical protein